MANLSEHNKLILFDGVCNLCNASVVFVIKRDKADLFRFAPLQSDIGKAVMRDFDIDPAHTDSILLYEPGKGVTIKSAAALKIASKLGFPVNLLSIFYIIPRFIRNWVYDVVARNRYKWYGKRDVCMVPTPELQAKFLS